MAYSTSQADVSNDYPDLLVQTDTCLTASFAGQSR